MVFSLFSSITVIAIFALDDEFDGCAFETDNTWGIVWPNTQRGSSSEQRCPGGADVLGIFGIIRSRESMHAHLYYFRQCYSIL